MVDRMRRGLLGAFATVVGGSLAGCTDAFDRFGGEDTPTRHEPVTLCRIGGRSKIPEPHDVTITVHDGDETVIEETIRLDPSTDDEWFLIDEPLPMESSSEPFRIMAAHDRHSETFDAATLGYDPFGIYVEFREGGDIAIFHGEERC